MGFNSVFKGLNLSYPLESASLNPFPANVENMVSS